MFKTNVERLLKTLVGLILLIVTSGSNAVETSTYIVGGDDAQRDYPWIVALYHSDYFTCGAVLISSNWIATAAHCVYQDDDNSGDATAYDASYFDAVIGVSTHYSSTVLAQSSGVDVYAISDVVIHPSYDSDSYDYDIALLELETPVYQPGPALATEARYAQLEDSEYLTTIGYGMMSTEDDATAGEVIPSTLQEAELPFIPTDDCYWELASGTDVTDNMFCAGYEGGDTTVVSCSGDSGGPIFTSIDGELTLLGLVSWGASGCGSYPGVYTNISNLRSWVLGYIDGKQVVEEGTAIYDEVTETFESGLISVYHYGNDDDDGIEIGDLNFDDSDILQVFTLDNTCSGYSIYESDGSCQIYFDLLDVPAGDELYTAELTVDNVSYDLRFNEEYLSEGESIDSSGSASSLSVTYNSGSMKISWLLIILLCNLMRLKVLLRR